MMKMLDQKVALVTGGTAGIGKAIAAKFVEQGARVIIFGTNSEKGLAAVKDIENETNCDDVEFMQVNVANTKEVEDAVQSLLEKYGQVDVLVNNAGITRDKLMMRMSEEDWDQVMDVNVKSCYNLCRVLVRPMMRAQTGNIINISSVVGLRGEAGQTNYAASKAAVIGFTKALAKEIARKGVRVNCIAPGFIETQMTDSLQDVQKEAFLKQTPLGRFGKPVDIANVALFLASTLSEYITGQVIAVDGGVGIGA